MITEPREIKYCWALALFGQDISTISAIYHHVLDAGNEHLFCYTFDDVVALNRIRKQVPQPVFSDDVFEAQKQINEYANQILLQWNQNTTPQQ